MEKAQFVRNVELWNQFIKSAFSVTVCIKGTIVQKKLGIPMTKQRILSIVNNYCKNIDNHTNIFIRHAVQYSLMKGTKGPSVAETTISSFPAAPRGHHLQAIKLCPRSSEEPHHPIPLVDHSQQTQGLCLSDFSKCLRCDICTFLAP